jgi:hypothetical protein
LAVDAAEHDGATTASQRAGGCNAEPVLCGAITSNDLMRAKVI